MIKNLIIIHFLISSFFGYTQQDKDSIAIPVDKNQAVTARGFESNLQDKYIGSEFDYTSQEGKAQNLIARFLQWLFNWIDESFGINIPPYALEIVEYIIYILMGCLVIYLLVRFLLGENFSSLFTKKATSIIDINLSEDHIENVDLDTLIKTAIDNKDYRLAVRYQYLRILKSLSEKDIIDWHYEKTNSDYQNEIESQNSSKEGVQLKTGFKKVSYLYDYIWYGEQEIDANKYETIETRFSSLKKLIHT
ncbi:DUF4129 domain-containing protein [Aurantibacter crassamenti]|uniref:DUF4129 domain-containing protein n=1 Tax=Aurantibacter crassamenti TaxID=1837375 RepID=UPI0019394CF6|nr:DUF4129 domain-containing protein [Aurantibacter crassamenti]MBM1107894.1 DUF4129 domain-containing protein [Aurantibacter crassamenti]